MERIPVQPRTEEEGTVGVYRFDRGPAGESRPVRRSAEVKPAAPKPEAVPEVKQVQPPAFEQVAKKTGRKRGLILGIVGALLVAAAVLAIVFLGGREGDPFSLSASERRQIGNNPQLAASAKNAASSTGTVPYLFGIKKADAEAILMKETNNISFYTMRYNLKRDCPARIATSALRTDPPMGSELGARDSVSLELSRYPMPNHAVYFHAFYNEDGSIKKGVYLDQNGEILRFVWYSYAVLENGNTQMTEAHYLPDGTLVDLWSHEFMADGYLRSTVDPAYPWMRQIHYDTDGKILSVFIWEKGKWTKG